MNYYNSNNILNQNNAVNAIDQMALLISLWRGKWILFILVLLGVVIADFYVRRIAVPLYPATATIALQDEKVQIISDIESIMSNGPITNTGINTELEVLRSRNLVGELVDILDLSKRNFFDPHLGEILLFSRIKQHFFALFGFSSENLETVKSDEQVRSNVISSVLKVMEFSNIKSTQVINISATTTDPALSVLMANSMAKLYIESQIQVKLESLANATKFLSKRTFELKQKFEGLKTQIAQLSSQSELINPAVLNAQESQLREVRMRILESREQFLKESNKIFTFRSSREVSDMDGLIKTANDFRLNRIFSQYRNNNVSINVLNLEVDHFMANAEAKLGREEKKLLALEESASVLAKQIERQSKELLIYQQLERETEAARHLYESFLTRLLELNVQMGIETADGRIISEATLRHSSSPKKNFILAISGTLGLLIGIGLVLLREIQFSGFRSINELQNNSGCSVLASLPLIPKRKKKNLISYLKKKPNSIFSEAIRNLRTSILMSNLDPSPQVIMFTSSISGEGKTTIAYSLAQNMTGLGKNVLLIEADIRRINQTVDIDSKNTVALVDLLIGSVKLKDVDLFVDEMGFSVLSGAKSDQNAADLFSTEHFSQLIAELRENYDYILIDTPPVLVVPDARVIAGNIDANIYIVEWNKTTRAQVDQGLKMLSSVSVNSTGLILNQVNTQKVKTYGYANQYGYGLYGSKYYQT